MKKLFLLNLIKKKIRPPDIESVRVSVIIPTFNRMSFLIPTLICLFNQKFTKRFAFLFLSTIFLFSCKNKDLIIIPFEFNEAQIILEAVVNGKFGRYLFDTGSPISYTNVALDNYKLNKKEKIAFWEETETVSIYSVPSIKIGGQTFSGEFNITNTLPVLKTFLKQQYFSGVLGLDVFKGYWCKISIPDRKIYLSKTMFKNSGKKFPCSFRQGYLETQLEIDGKNKSFIIDTIYPAAVGFSNSAISEFEDKKVKELYGYPKPMYVISLDEIKLGNYKKKNIYTYTNSPFSNNGFITQNVIGINFLRGFDFTVDLTNYKQNDSTTLLWKKRFLNYPYYFNQRYITETGIWFYTTLDNIITATEKDSFVDVNGIKPGDKIVKINGEYFAFMENKKKNKYLFHPEDGTVFTIQQDDIEREIVFRK